MNCPGDPGCYGNPITLNPQPVFVATGISTALQNLPLIGPYTGGMLGSTQPVPLSLIPFGAGGASFTDWLNQNSKTVLWLAAAFLGALLLMRVAR